MGWLRSVGSIKLNASFAEYRLFYTALLQKRPRMISILLAKATPQARLARNVSTDPSPTRFETNPRVACIIPELHGIWKAQGHYTRKPSPLNGRQLAVPPKLTAGR